MNLNQLYDLIETLNGCELEKQMEINAASNTFLEWLLANKWQSLWTASKQSFIKEKKEEATT